MAQFKTRLKELRLERHYTQEDLAKLLKTSRSRIGMYESGNREPDFETQEAIADLFNVDLDFLLGRSDVKRTVHYVINDFTDEEIELIKNFRAANADTKKMVLSILAYGIKMSESN